MALATFNSDPNTTSSFAPRPAYSGSPYSNEGGANAEPGPHGFFTTPITSLSNTTPIVVTVPSNPFTDGDTIRIAGVVGADGHSQHAVCTTPNSRATDGRTWTVANGTGTTFELSGSTSGGGTGTGGVALSYAGSTEQQFQAFTEAASARSTQTKVLTGTIDYLPAYQGDQGLVLDFEEGSGQSFHAGDLLVFSASKAVLATTPTLGTELIIGFAMNDATGVTGAPCRVRVPRLTDTFIGNFAPDEAFSPSSSPGSTVGLSQNEPGVWVLDSDGDPVVQLLTSQQENQFGFTPTAGGRIYFKFI